MAIRNASQKAQYIEPWGGWGTTTEDTSGFSVLDRQVQRSEIKVDTVSNELKVMTGLINHHHLMVVSELNFNSMNPWIWPAFATI